MQRYSHTVIHREQPRRDEKIEPRSSVWLSTACSPVDTDGVLLADWSYPVNMRSNCPTYDVRLRLRHKLEDTTQTTPEPTRSGEHRRNHVWKHGDQSHHPLPFHSPSPNPHPYLPPNPKLLIPTPLLSSLPLPSRVDA